MPYYTDLGRLDYVDIGSVMCLVGRVPDGRAWALIDRTGNLAQSLYIPEASGSYED